MAQVNIDPNNIDIVRDSFGVPHIFAKTDAEVAYGLAWATAEDDFETAQFLMLAVKGKLGKYLGPDGAKVDYAVQFMQVNEYVAANYDTRVSNDFKKVLEGYAAGANAYAETHPDEVLVKGTFPITAQDVIVGYMLGIALMGGVDGQVTAIVDGSIANNMPDNKPRPGVGSNAIAVNSKRSADGNTYLAINSHQPLEGLLSWYEAHLHSDEGWNIVGGLFHGGVSVFHGTNEYLGWAHTTGHINSSDVFKLEMHPKKKNLYRVDGKWYKLETHVAKLRVAVGKHKHIVIPVRKRYWTSIYGPAYKNQYGVFALRMPALMRVEAPEQWYRMNKAKNFSEFHKALEMQGLSLQNITYADKYDTIFFNGNGVVPERNRNYNWNKVLPGDTTATLWNDYIPVDSMAWVINPECGVVFNVNNSSFDPTCVYENLKPKNFDPNIGYQEVDNNRSLRMRELLDSYSQISYDDLKKIKFDNTYPKDTLIFMRDFPIMGLYDLDPKQYPDIADVIAKIHAFDGTTDIADTNFAVLLVTMNYMYNNSSGKVGKLNEDAAYRDSFFVEQIRLAKAHMLKYFGTISAPLGDVQVLRRGDVTLPIQGGPDQIRAVYAPNVDKDGRFPDYVGDSYIQLVQFTKDGPIIESISPYGASNKPDSPNYTSQMQMFVNEQLKPMSLDKDVVYKHAEKIYHPKKK